jgi:tetratricopeptide (TPR) repeat protein
MAALGTAFAVEDTPMINIYYGAAHHNTIALAVKADEELHRGELENARRDADAALRLDAKFWPALYTRAKLLLQQGRWQEAIRDCDAGLQQDHSVFEFAVLRAMANTALGRYAAALAELDHLIRIRPPRATAFADAFAERAWLRINARDPAFRDAQKAIADAKQACNLMQWRYADEIDTLAAAYANAGDFDAALRYEEQAMKTTGAERMSKTLQEHLAFIQQHRAPQRTR